MYPRKNRAAIALLAALLLVCRSAVSTEQATAACPSANEFAKSQQPYSTLVVIIDDMGHSLNRGMHALNLHGKINYAVIPHTRYGKRLAEEAHLRGKEVMLHVPMSTLQNTPLGKGGLTPDLTRQEFRASLNESLLQIPHVRGVNNHMGSDLTQRRRQMAWLMQDLRWKDLYFVDSRTTDKTVAATVAAEFSVPNLSRQVFLDNERSLEAIDERFLVLVDKAEKEGLAVAIGHPYPETITYLRDALPLLAERGVQLLYVSEALQRHGGESCTNTSASGKDTGARLRSAPH